MYIKCIFGKHKWGMYRCHTCNKYKPYALSMAFNNLEQNVILMILKSKQIRKQMEVLKKNNISPLSLAVKYKMPRIISALIELVPGILDNKEEIKQLIKEAEDQGNQEIVDLLKT